MVAPFGEPVLLPPVLLVVAPLGILSAAVGVVPVLLESLVTSEVPVPPAGVVISEVPVPDCSSGALLWQAPSKAALSSRPARALMGLFTDIVITKRVVW